MKVALGHYLVLLVFDSDCAFVCICQCFHMWRNFNKNICQEHLPCSNHLGPIIAIKNSIMGEKKCIAGI